LFYLKKLVYKGFYLFFNVYLHLWIRERLVVVNGSELSMTAATWYVARRGFVVEALRTVPSAHPGIHHFTTSRRASKLLSSTSIGDDWVEEETGTECPRC